VSLFVVLEGPDGCGKSTQAGRLVEHLRGGDHEVVSTREPGATPVGAVIRSIVLGDADIDPTTEALLIAADRAEHVAKVIRPALARGAVVVSDRYVPSSLAYQGVARGLGTDVVERLSAAATGGLEPDLVVVLDVGPEVAAARRTASPDRLEREPAFQEAVRRAYRDLAASHGWHVIDGCGPVDEVADQVWKLVSGLFMRLGEPEKGHSTG
jgi:dTMP kinase